MMTLFKNPKFWLVNLPIVIFIVAFLIVVLIGIISTKNERKSSLVHDWLASVHDWLTFCWLFFLVAGCCYLLFLGCGYLLVSLGLEYNLIGEGFFESCKKIINQQISIMFGSMPFYNSFLFIVILFIVFPIFIMLFVVSMVEKTKLRKRR